jgi:hypothetical protein
MREEKKDRKERGRKEGRKEESKKGRNWLMHP